MDIDFSVWFPAEMIYFFFGMFGFIYFMNKSAVKPSQLNQKMYSKIIDYITKHRKDMEPKGIRFTLSSGFFPSALVLHKDFEHPSFKEMEA
mmetsp:Transcript_27392/g.24151  ORF Transcript_27392/g.24151 Transcript_27392/m.24151 type:complete len:91 (-) Transcript_27392:50-322(-)